MRDHQHEKECHTCTLNCILASVSKNNDPSPLLNKREIVFKKGETVFKQGTFLSKIIFIHEGLVKLYMEGKSGKDLIVRLYHNQQYIGLTRAFGKNESRYTAQALKKTRICIIEINFFRKLLANNPALNEKIYTIFNEEHDFLFARLGTLGTKNLQGRLAETIIYLSDPHLQEFDIYSNITRKDLAEFSGMSVESMIRLLNEFKHDKLIRVEGKKIGINDIELLKMLSRVG